MTRTPLLLLAIFALSLGVRLGYVLTGESNPLGEGPRDADIAHNLIDEGRWFYLNEKAIIRMSLKGGAHHRLVEPDTVDFAALNKGVKLFPEVAEPIGSAAVLAAVWGVTGHERYLPMQILQAILDALATLLVYRIAMLLLKRRRAALIAAVLYALYVPIAWQTMIVYDDIWAVDFTLVVVAAYLEARNSTSHPRRWLLTCALLAGLGAYFRPAVIVLPLAIALAIAPRMGRRTVRQGLMVTAMAALLLVPWTIRNYEDFHAFIPTRSSFWENMWYGLGEKPNDFGATEDVAGKLAREIARVRPGLRFESPAWDAYIKPRVVNALEDHPFYYLKLLVYRTGLATIVNYQPEWMQAGTRTPIGYPGGPSAFILQPPLGALEDAFQPGIFLLDMIAISATLRRFRRLH